MVKLKRVYEKAEAGDGPRYLVETVAARCYKSFSPNRGLVEKRSSERGVKELVSP